MTAAGVDGFVAPIPGKSHARSSPLVNLRRSAHASIRGYLYQACLSAQRWLELGGDEILVCEGDEDIDQLVRGGDADASADAPSILLMRKWRYSKLSSVNTHVEVSDALLAELTIIAARENRTLRAVLEETVALGVTVRRNASAGGTAVHHEAEAWMNRWQDLGRRIEERSLDLHPCVEVLLDDRR